MKASERVVTAAIAEQARAWLIINREHGLPDERRKEFLAWLQASPLHVREYLAVAKLAAELRTVVDTVDTPTEVLIAMAREEPEDNVTSIVRYLRATSEISARPMRRLADRR